MIQKYFRYFLFLLSILAGILVIVLGFFTVPTVDDYAVLAQVRRMPWIEYALHNYFFWDGRILHYAILGLLIRDIYTLKYVTVFWAFNFTLIAVLTELHWRRTQDNHRSSIVDTVTRSGIILAVLWLGMRPVLRHGVYWATCGIYTLWSSLALIWLYSLDSFLRRAEKCVSKYCNMIVVAVFFLTGILMGAATQNLTIGLLAFCFLFLFSRKDFRQKRNVLVIWACVAGLMIGFAVIMLAPGLSHRLAVSEGALDFHPIQALQNFLEIFGSYLYLDTRLFLFTLFGGMGLLYYRRTFISANNIAEEQNTTSLYPLPIGKWFIAGFATIIPMLAVPEQAALKRTAMFFLIFWTIGALGLLKKMTGIKKLARLSESQFFLRVFAPLFTVGLFGLFLYYLVRDVRQAIPHQKEVFKRHESILLHSHASKNISVDRVKTRAPYSIMFYDIRKDPNHPINTWVADYYNIYSIRRIR